MQVLAGYYIPVLAAAKPYRLSYKRALPPCCPREERPDAKLDVMRRYELCEMSA